MFDQNEIYLLKGNKPTTTKDFQKTLEAFGNLLKYTKNENNDFVDLSYMISEIMKKQIKPFDFDYLNNKTKKQVMEVKIPFMKLNAKQNDF
jgi:6-pyruvoyl-tetrahydropterin synthase